MHKLVFGCSLHSVEYVILKAFIQSSQDVTFSSAISNSLFTLNCLNILNKRLANTTMGRALCWGAQILWTIFAFQWCRIILSKWEILDTVLCRYYLHKYIYWKCCRLSCRCLHHLLIFYNFSLMLGLYAVLVRARPRLLVRITGWCQMSALSSNTKQARCPARNWFLEGDRGDCPCVHWVTSWRVPVMASTDFTMTGNHVLGPSTEKVRLFPPIAMSNPYLLKGSAALRCAPPRARHHPPQQAGPAVPWLSAHVAAPRPAPRGESRPQ